MTRRRELAELAGGLVALALIFACVRLFVPAVITRGFFAVPSRSDPAGGAIWSNLAASVVCLAVVWWRIRVRMIAHHAEALALAVRQHRERMALAARHHQEQVTLIGSHHAELKAHLSQVMSGHSGAVGELADATRAVLAHQITSKAAT